MTASDCTCVFVCAGVRGMHYMYIACMCVCGCCSNQRGGQVYCDSIRRYVCVCLRVCMYSQRIDTHIRQTDGHIHAYIQAHSHIYDLDVGRHTYIHTYIHIYIHTYKRIAIFTILMLADVWEVLTNQECMFVCMYVSMYVCIHKELIHITDTRTRTHTHTYKRIAIFTILMLAGVWEVLTNQECMDLITSNGAGEKVIYVQNTCIYVCMYICMCVCM